MAATSFWVSRPTCRSPLPGRTRIVGLRNAARWADRLSLACASHSWARTSAARRSRRPVLRQTCRPANQSRPSRHWPLRPFAAIHAGRVRTLGFDPAVAAPAVERVIIVVHLSSLAAAVAVFPPALESRRAWRHCLHEGQKNVEPGQAAFVFQIAPHPLALLPPLFVQSVFGFSASQPSGGRSPRRSPGPGLFVPSHIHSRLPLTCQREDRQTA